METAVRDDLETNRYDAATSTLTLSSAEAQAGRGLERITIGTLRAYLSGSLAVSGR